MRVNWDQRWQALDVCSRLWWIVVVDTLYVVLLYWVLVVFGVSERAQPGGQLNSLASLWFSLSPFLAGLSMWQHDGFPTCYENKGVRLGGIARGSVAGLDRRTDGWLMDTRAPTHASWPVHRSTVSKYITYTHQHLHISVHTHPESKRVLYYISNSLITRNPWQFFLQ